MEFNHSIRILLTHIIVIIISIIFILFLIRIDLK